jgi:hypothetical protein
MSDLYWDPSQPASGGTTQTLQLNGQTLSLVPGGGSVQLPVGVVSSLGPVLVVSTIIARNNVIVGPNSNIVLTSTGQFRVSSIDSQFLNSLAINATNTTTTNLSTTNTQATNLGFITETGRQANIQNVSSAGIYASSITFGQRYQTTFSEDQDAVFQTKITGRDINMYVNLSQYGPGQNINGRYFNGENYNATSSINVGSNIIASNANSNAIITLNGHTLSNTNNNLTYDGQPITTGQRGDASQWAQFPANTYVNANGQDVRNVNGLYANGIQAGGATLDTQVNLATNQQNGNVQILTKPYSGSVFTAPGPGLFKIGFPNYIETNPFLVNMSYQPEIDMYGNKVNIAAGAPVAPGYFEGRTINIDAYAGLSPVPSIVPVLPNANSYINITAHGNSVSALDKYLGSGSGNITLRAYNSYFPPGIVPNPLAPGTITLDAANVFVGNPNYTGLGTSALVNLQSAVVQIIAGLDFAGISPFGEFAHTRIRSRDGLSIENTPTGSNNRDSKLYVREIFGYSNFVNDFGPPALNLDGLDGGLTLNNFVSANGQGDGADLNNIATMSGAYPTNVQNQINALQNTIGNLSTTGGTSNIAQWSAFPALSTVVANRDLNFTNTAASISSLNGVIFNNTAGTLTNTYQKRVYLDGKNATSGSTMMYYDVSAVSFINPGNLAYNNIRGQGIYLGAGTSNYLTAVSSILYFNGQALTSTVNGGSGGSVGPNPKVSTLTVNYASGFVQVGTQQITNVGLFADVNVLGVQDSNGGVRPFVAFPVLGGYYSGGYTRINNQSIDFLQPNTGTGFNFASFSGTSNISLNNISTINSIPISSFINGNSGPSSIQNWSYFPVLSNAIQFGNQSVWIKGETNALFTTSSGSNTIPVLAKSFSIYDPNNVSVIRNIGFDSNGILTAKRTNDHPSDFRVSSLVLGTSPLTTDGTDLYLNGTNIGSGNTAQWANYRAISTINGDNLVLSNANASMSIFAPQVGMTDPRSSSLFVSPFQIQMINKGPVNRNILGMTNSCNAFYIQNDSGGVNMYTYGDPGRISVDSDFVILPQNTLRATSTATRSIVVSSMMINGNNTLTVTGGNLTFNGAPVTTSNTVNTWSQYPAISNVDMNGYSIQNAGSIITSNFVPQTSGYSINATGAAFNGNIIPLVVTNTAPGTYRPAIMTGGNGAWNGGLYASNTWVGADKGFAFTNPGPINWNNIEAPTDNTFNLNQYNGSNLISTGRVYDTTFNKLPTFALVPCGAQNTIVTFSYPGGTTSSWTTIPGLGTFVPTTNQGLVSFSVLPPASYTTSNCLIGVGPVGNTNYSNTYTARIANYDSSLQTFDRYTLLCDFTGFVGSNYNFRMAGIPSGFFQFNDAYYKPLPN